MAAAAPGCLRDIKHGSAGGQHPEQQNKACSACILRVQAVVYTTLTMLQLLIRSTKHRHQVTSTWMRGRLLKMPSMPATQLTQQRLQSRNACTSSTPLWNGSHWLRMAGLLHVLVVLVLTPQGLLLLPLPNCSLLA